MKNIKAIITNGNKCWKYQLRFCSYLNRFFNIFIQILQNWHHWLTNKSNFGLFDREASGKCTWYAYLNY